MTGISLYTHGFKGWPDGENSLHSSFWWLLVVLFRFCNSALVVVQNSELDSIVHGEERAWKEGQLYMNYLDAGFLSFSRL